MRHTPFWIGTERVSDLSVFTHDSDDGDGNNMF